MKLVDTKNILRVHSAYFNVEQPMPIYDSTEEFEANVDTSKATLIHNVKEYMDWVLTLTGTEKEIKFDFGQSFISFVKMNIWLKTDDAFIPSYVTPDGSIYYKVDTDGNFMRTDGCWIRLYYIVQKRTSHLLYTSSGMHLAAITNYGLTGGVKQDYANVHQATSNRTREENQELIIRKIMRRKKPGIEHMRMMFAFFNPLSDTAHELKKSFRAGFKRMPYKYMESVIASPAFKEAVMQTIKTIYPGLVDAITAMHTPEEMAKFLNEMKDKAIDAGNIGDMVTVFDKILETGYAQAEVTNMPNIPQLPAQPGNQVHTGIPVIGEEEEKPHVREEDLTPDIKIPTQEELEKDLDDQGVPISYIQEEHQPLINVNAIVDE